MDEQKSYESIGTTFADSSAITIISSNPSVTCGALPGYLSSQFELKGLISLPTDKAVNEQVRSARRKYPKLKIGLANINQVDYLKETDLVYATDEYTIDILTTSPVGKCLFDAVFATSSSIIPYWWVHRNDVRLVTFGNFDLPFKSSLINIESPVVKKIAIEYIAPTMTILDEMIDIVNSLKTSVGHKIIVYSYSDLLAKKLRGSNIIVANNIYEVVSNNVQFVVDPMLSYSLRCDEDDQIAGPKYELLHINDTEFKLRKAQLIDGGRYIKVIDEANDIPNNLSSCNNDKYSLILSGINITGLYPAKLIDSWRDKLREYHLIGSKGKQIELKPAGQFYLNHLPITSILGLSTTTFLSKWLKKYSLLEGIMLASIVELSANSFFYKYDSIDEYRGPTALHTYYNLWLGFLESLGDYDPVTDKTPKGGRQREKNWIEANGVNGKSWNKLIQLARTIYLNLNTTYDKIFDEDISSDEIVDRAIVILTKLHQSKTATKVKINTYKIPDKPDLYIINKTNKISDLDLAPPNRVIIVNSVLAKDINYITFMIGLTDKLNKSNLGEVKRLRPSKPSSFNTEPPEPKAIKNTIKSSSKAKTPTAKSNSLYKPKIPTAKPTIKSIKSTIPSKTPIITDEEVKMELVPSPKQSITSTSKDEEVKMELVPSPIKSAYQEWEFDETPKGLWADMVQEVEESLVDPKVILNGKKKVVQHPFADQLKWAKKIKLDRTIFPEYTDMYENYTTSSTKPDDKITADVQQYVDHFQLNIPYDELVKYNVTDSLSEAISDGRISYPSTDDYLYKINEYLEHFDIPEIIDVDDIRYIAEYEDGMTKLIYLTNEMLDADMFIDHFTEFNRRNCTVKNECAIKSWTAYADQVAAKAVKIATKLKTDLNGAILSKAIFSVVNHCELTSISATLAIYNMLEPKVIFDVSASWGERAIAAHLTNSVTKYVGFDTNTDIFTGYQQLSEYIQDKRINLMVGDLLDFEDHIIEADLIHIDGSKLSYDNHYLNMTYIANRVIPFLTLGGHLIIYDPSKDQSIVGIFELFNDPELVYLGPIGVTDGYRNNGDNKNNKYFHIWQKRTILDLGIPDDIMSVIDT
jgi:hypothetical protein